MDADKDWKKSVGFPINYSPEESEDDPDRSDVVMRHPRQSELLLTDKGDGAEADLLGTTPPRERIRDKQKRRAFMDSVIFRDTKRSDSMTSYDLSPDRPRNTRLSLKIRRGKERDFKQDKAVSLPSPNPVPAVPTLVESCNRFMCLTSRLKHRQVGQDTPEEQEEPERRTDEEFPPNRVNFHKTFSMLINMGNADKGCRRTISREEQVWQNELKDLIWLELQAKIAGRTLAEQDAFLVAQRNIVPAIVQSIKNYRFINSNPCPNRPSHLKRHLSVIEGSTEDLTEIEGEKYEDQNSSCLSFHCQPCADAVGKAMREVGTLLDSYYNASSLYPSSHGMTADHPLVATHLFKNRLKAMCLWYNTALHMRLKMLAVRRIIRTMKLKSRRRGLSHLTSTESDVSRQSSENSRQCQVRFNVSNTPSDSNNSDSSGHNDVTKAEDTAYSEQTVDKPGNISNSRAERKISRDEGHETEEEEERKGEGVEDRRDEVDSNCDKKLDQSTATTPEIVISDSTIPADDSQYGTSDTMASSESDYVGSSLDSNFLAASISDNVYDIGNLQDITMLRLLNKCEVSIYRSYHHEMLKIQGVRRCMQFINKMRKRLLIKVYHTLEKPDNQHKDQFVKEGDDHPTEVFEDTREDEDRFYAVDDDSETFELRRFGCWSDECLSMGLPSYRNHFLLLSSICMEAVHDYLSLRLEDRPQNPSCLTVKQLIHELKEGLDIATEMRAVFAKNIEVALAGQSASEEARNDLLLIIRAFDATIETVLKQYLSYLKTMSGVDEMGKANLQAEWTFTAQLAKRVKCAALLAPVTFSDIVCNQLERIRRRFEDKFENIAEFGKNAVDPNRQFVYAICRATQDVYASERDATMQTVQWARMLAVRLGRAPLPAYKTQRAAIFESIMKLRDLIVGHTYMIFEKSRMKYEDCSPMSRDAYDILTARTRELMLQIYKLGFEMHKELHKFVEESPRLYARKSSIKHRVKFNRSDSIGDDVDSNVFEITGFGDNQTQSSIELLLTGSPARAASGAGQAARGRAGGAVSGEELVWATRVARAVVECAKCWMGFVVERCEKGRGLRPRWASQGLEFLMLACDPCNTKHLTEEEFEDLKKQMDGCISHVIGSRPAAPRPDSACSAADSRPRRPRLHSPLPSTGASSNSSSRSVPAPPTPPCEPDPLLNFTGVDFAAHSSRVVKAVQRLDESREQKLLDMKCVGRVLEATVLSYEPKLRQLTFKWQRGLKIGAGTFGKVYTVVNTETGQLLAMKEISIGCGGARALQRAANELKVLEGVIHPHLVRYYGCELHREEMLLFMELCVEGSLEALIATSGALEETMVRRYTKQLVSAVTELHTRSIAHRDIKSGNIFLTNEGNCLKLGDFGCAVKIRANTTAAGELMGHVGTQAYMAPEVFMKPTGHGRAADVWSLGCVVTEMASGKRPFSEYDSNVQIMFVVGMGGRPGVPDDLSEEGRQFCLACLTHEPELRPKAEALGMHHFLKLKADEECNCEPAFLIA